MKEMGECNEGTVSGEFSELRFFICVFYRVVNAS
jgi:hypothetical protein